LQNALVCRVGNAQKRLLYEAFSACVPKKNPNQRPGAFSGAESDIFRNARVAHDRLVGQSEKMTMRKNRQCQSINKRACRTGDLPKEDAAKNPAKSF
jgi:hypothetical protein